MLPGIPDDGYSAGYEAAVDGEPISSCPFVPSDPEGSPWRSGWLSGEGLKRQWAGTYGAGEAEWDRARADNAAVNRPDPVRDILGGYDWDEPPKELDGLAVIFADPLLTYADLRPVDQVTLDELDAFDRACADVMSRMAADINRSIFGDRPRLSGIITTWPSPIWTPPPPATLVAPPQPTWRCPAVNAAAIADLPRWSDLPSSARHIVAPVTLPTLA